MTAVNVEVDATAVLQASGIVEVLRVPADGVDRNTHLNWNGATFGVVAAIDTDRQQDQMIMHYTGSDGRKLSQGFAIDLQRGEVASTSGWHPAGRGRLSPSQTTILTALVKASFTRRVRADRQGVV